MALPFAAGQTRAGYAGVDDVILSGMNECMHACTVYAMHVLSIMDVAIILFTRFEIIP